MNNGNKNGLFNGRFSRVDDIIIKVGAGVAVIILAASIFFGMRVYAISENVFTEQMHNESVNAAWVAARDEFVQSDVYERDREYLDRRLDSIDANLIKLLEK